MNARTTGQVGHLPGGRGGERLEQEVTFPFKTPAAISKQFSGRWGMDRYPQWAPLIQAASRFYTKEHTPQDLTLMKHNLEAFFPFMVAKISAARELSI